MSTAKSFIISKSVVWEAYQQVKANKGAAGVDNESISDFEKHLKDNLYQIWNRMSSGSYMPPPVKLVEIPKKDGGKRPLGIPTVSDRVAQMVVKIILEPELEPFFHEDSYGYRPKKSALDAVGVARQRCWHYNWVIDMDIKGFFSNMDHELLMKALNKHTDCKWVLLYIERWLKAPDQLKDGTLVNRTKGVPQGSVVGPLLSNLFLHYAFDQWMKINYPENPFEHFADDQIVHCKTETQAQQLKNSIEKRYAVCGLELHAEKTKIAHCKDENRKDNYPNEKFDFLGFTFRARRSVSKSGKLFVSFTPSVSNKAKKSIGQVIRSWRLHLRSDKSLEDIANFINPALRGWINYYGRYYKSGLRSTFYRINHVLFRWATRKFKRFRTQKRKAGHWLGNVEKQCPKLFAHWHFGVKPATGQ